MADAGPRRRRIDRWPDDPPALGSAPGALAQPDPQALLRALAEALEAARRQRRAATLVNKSVPEGDGAVLERVADLARATVRDTDVIWRDGQGGLALLLADADGPASEPALARLRLRLRGRGMIDVQMGRAAPAPGIGAAELLVLARADARPIGGP